MIEALAMKDIAEIPVMIEPGIKVSAVKGYGFNRGRNNRNGNSRSFTFPVPAVE